MKEVAETVAPAHKRGSLERRSSVEEAFSKLKRRPPMNEPDFLARFRVGERTVLAEIYWFYRRMVERLVCRRKGRRDGHVGLGVDVSDIVHEVFVRAFAPPARTTYDGVRPYERYLVRIARNALVDCARRTRRELPLEPKVLEEATNHGEDDLPWANPQVMKCVQDYISGLPEDLRDLHRCRFADGMSQSRAAQMLQCSRQALRTREKRLRSGLLDALKRAGLNLSE
jgi:RNA polymerase sigma factor (sigma-70 family)